MGVDYSAAFGIGFVVEPSELAHLMIKQDNGRTAEDFDDMELMECISLPDGLGYSYWGNSYSGHHTFFVTTSEHATSKEQMIEHWDVLEQFIKDSKLEDKSVALIGGGLVW